MVRIFGFLLLILVFPNSGCLSLWPWGYSTTVVETADEVVARRHVAKTETLNLKRNYRTRAITPFEKQYDANQNGFLEGDELVYFRQAQMFRRQEKQLRGER